MAQSRKKQIKCYYCHGNHSCRQCPVEFIVAPYMKQIIGIHMETFVANKLKCPRCNKTLHLVGNHSPSLDIICNHCKTNFEVKSKCISAPKIPKDLILNHGNYFDYVHRQDSGLDFIIIIYGVDRTTKTITIRKVFHVPDKMVQQKIHFNVVKKTNSSMSDIIIPNNEILVNITPNHPYSYDFTNNINQIINASSQHINSV